MKDVSVYLKHILDSIHLRDRYPEVRWKGIVATRNLLIHEYFGVNVQEVWDIAIKDLPILKDQTEKMLNKLIWKN